MAAEATAPVSADYAAPHKGIMSEVPLSWLAPSPFNPRATFAEEALDELAASIKTHGMLQPIIVRELRPPTPASSDGCYQILGGERRYRAAQRLGMAFVPVVVRIGVDDDQAQLIALTENLLRVDLDPIEKARGIGVLRDRYGLRQTGIAERLGCNQSEVARMLGLLKLPSEAQELIRAGQLSASHGELLQRWQEYPALQTAIAAFAAEHKLSTRQLEQPLSGQSDLVKALAAAGLVKLLDSYSNATAFDARVCLSCPLGAYRASDDYRPSLCLRPDHYAQLTREAETEHKRQLAAAAIKAKAAGKVGVPKLSELGYQNYEQIGRGHGTPPAGCTDACPCRSVALDWGDKPVIVCLDPKRHKGLKMAEARAAGKDRRAAVALERERLAKHLEELTLISSRELAVIVHQALEHANVDVLRKAVGRSGTGLTVHTTSLTDRIPRHELAKLDPLALVRLAVDVLLSINLNARAEMDCRAEVFEWYMDGTVARGGAQQPRCTVCRQPLAVPPGTVLERYLCDNCAPGPGLGTALASGEGACSACGAGMELAGEDLADPASALCAECAG